MFDDAAETIRTHAAATLPAHMVPTAVMVIDGAMGTAIQRDRPDEAGYRGVRFADWPSDLKGNNDLLSITQPQIIREIHDDYLAAGADILDPLDDAVLVEEAVDVGLHGLAEVVGLRAPGGGGQLLELAAGLVGQLHGGGDGHGGSPG